MELVTLEINNLVTFRHAARELGVSRPTVYNLIKRHLLHPLKIGNNTYLLRHEVEGLKEKLKGG